MSSWFTPSRTLTLKWIAAGSVCFGAVAVAAFVVWPQIPAPGDAVSRLVGAIMLLRWPALLVVLMIASLFRIFDSDGAVDPLAGLESRRHRINQRVLQNSVEHMAFFAPAVCALACVADTVATWRLVPMAVALFSAGRVAFWVGYHLSPNARSLGFQLSFSTALITLALAFALG